MTLLSRRSLALLATMPTRFAIAQTLTRIRITQPAESLSYMPIYVARAQQWFAAEGLDPEIVITRGDGPDVNALMAGDVEFVATPPHYLYTLFLKGQHLLGVGGILGRCGISLAISRSAAAARGVTEQSPLADKLRALKGLTIGVSAPGSLTYNIAEYYARRAGLALQTDVKIVPIGANAAIIAAMQHGIIDCAANNSPLTDELVQRGLAGWLINNTLGEDPALKDFLHAVIYVRPDYLQNNPDVVRRMLRALVRAEKFIHDNPVETIAPLLRPYFKSLDEPVFLSAIRNVREAVIPDGKMTEAASDGYENVLLSIGYLKQKVPFDAVFTNAYLPA
jgi:NitT/TauT family transport system substrate-binding protein